MPSPYERDYAELVRHILLYGDERNTRNAKAISTFGKTLTVHELRYGEFPLLSGRKMYPKGVLGELAAFLKGPKNIEDFENEGCNYWSKWADADGSINVDYGNLWLDFNGVNQLDALLDSLSTDPYGRRHIISGWNPANLRDLSLPCCHLLYQWYVNDNELDMIWYQRSVDMMIGLPSDVILAAAWNVLIANHVGLNPGKLIFMLGDTHIYSSHKEQAMQYVKKAIERPRDVVGYFVEGTLDDFNIGFTNYNPDKPINFELH